jgi:arabinan endo-1,5-alpha-L-arabinosidase
MFEGGGTLVIEGNANYAGVGHNSTYTFDGKDYLVFHAYEMKDGQSRLRIKEIKWEKEWPVVTPME